jgi:hypothetical protein
VKNVEIKEELVLSAIARKRAIERLRDLMNT